MGSVEKQSSAWQTKLSKEEVKAAKKATKQSSASVALSLARGGWSVPVLEVEEMAGSSAVVCMADKADAIALTH